MQFRHAPGWADGPDVSDGACGRRTRGAPTSYKAISVRAPAGSEDPMIDECVAVRNFRKDFDTLTTRSRDSKQ
jgi:hypothetical protein